MGATPMHWASSASEAQQNRAPRHDPISKVRMPRLGGKASCHRGPSPAEAARDSSPHPPGLLPCTTLPTPARGGAPTDMSLLYSSRRCRLDAMNRPPFWIQPVCSPVSSSSSRLTTCLVCARSSTSTSLGRSCHSRPGGSGWVGTPSAPH